MSSRIMQTEKNPFKLFINNSTGVVINAEIVIQLFTTVRAMFTNARCVCTMHMHCNYMLLDIASNRRFIYYWLHTSRCKLKSRWTKFNRTGDLKCKYNKLESDNVAMFIGMFNIKLKLENFK